MVRSGPPWNKVADDPKPGVVVPPRSIYPARVDEKGRLKLPADFQQYLMGLGETKVFITSFEGAIGRIYPISEWLRVEELLREGGEDAEAGEDLWFLANAFGSDAEMDGQGRLTLPSELRKRLDVESQPVHLHHYRGHIRLYTQGVFDQKFGRAMDGAPDKLARYEKKGLR